MSAPTTAEVRERIGARLAMMRADDIKDGGGTAHQAYAWALTETALPIAEHRDALAAALGVVVERIGRAVERLGLGDAADCSVDDPDLGYLTAIEDLHNALDKARREGGEDAQAEVARLRSVLGNIATLDESDTDDLTEALTNWDVADVYASLGAAITSARMALDDAAKGAGR